VYSEAAAGPGALGCVEGDQPAAGEHRLHHDQGPGGGLLGQDAAAGEDAVPFVLVSELPQLPGRGHLADAGGGGADRGLHEHWQRPGRSEFVSARGDGRWTALLIATRANGQPAFGFYVRDPQTGISHTVELLVLTLSGSRICAITRFDNGVLPRFGLPRTLPG